MQLAAPTFVTETPRISCRPDAKLGAPVVAWTFSESSAHSSRPWASVLGAGGGVLVGLAVVFGVLLTGVVAGAVVLAGAVFAGVDFAGVVVGFVFAGAVVAGVLAGLGVTMVFVADVGVTGAEELDDRDELAEVDAPSRGRVRTAPPEASTPVKVGVGDPLATAAFEVPVDDFFDFWITRKPTPMSTTTAATITLTRRSQ